MPEYVKTLKNGEEIAFYSADSAIECMWECLDQVEGARRIAGKHFDPSRDFEIKGIRERYSRARAAAIKFGADKVSKFSRHLRTRTRPHKHKSSLI